MAALYPILDVDACARHNIAPLLVAEVWSELGVRKMQVRAKSWPVRDTLELLKQVRTVTRSSGCALFANDRLDLALLAECEGVHVGQLDLSPSVVRTTAPGLRVGVSTHDAVQLERALELRPDYVAFGPIFATRSKSDAEPSVGVDALARAHTRAALFGVRLVAIGGVSLERVVEVAGVCDEVAMIGALIGPTREHVRRQTQEVQAAIAELTAP